MRRCSLEMGELLEAIADPGNLAVAWTKVRANAGAAGVDGQTITAFGADSEHQLAARQREPLVQPERRHDGCKKHQYSSQRSQGCKPVLAGGRQPAPPLAPPTRRGRHNQGGR